MKSFNVQRYYDESAQIGEYASEELRKLRSDKTRELAIILQDRYADLFNRMTEDFEGFISECPHIQIIRNTDGMSIYTYRK